MPSLRTLRFTTRFNRPADFARYTLDVYRRSAENALRDSLPTIARLWQREAKRLCPVRTGALRASIRIKPIGRFKVRIQALFYAQFVRFTQRDFLAEAFERIRPLVLRVIQRNFRLAVF